AEAREELLHHRGLAAALRTSQPDASARIMVLAEPLTMPGIRQRQEGVLDELVARLDDREERMAFHPDHAGELGGGLLDPGHGARERRCHGDIAVLVHDDSFE